MSTWYRGGMRTQIAVRLPDELLSFIDSEVSERRAASRAAVVLRALERDRRRRIAERDAAIYAAVPDATDDLAAFVARTAHQPMDID